MVACAFLRGPCSSSGRAKGAAIGERGSLGRAAEVLAQRGGGAEAGARGDLLDRQIGLLEQSPRLEHPLGEQPLQRRSSRSRAGSGGRMCAG